MIRRILFLSLVTAGLVFGQQKVTSEKESALKNDAATQIDGMKKQAQVMVDTVFSFGELGFQEIETSKYLTGILEKEGFRVESGLAGIPTAFLSQVSSAQTWNKRTQITVNKPWALPNNVVLPAGTYVMRLYDSPSTRNIVEVWNADETKLETRVMGIPAYRLAPSSETKLNFYERKTPGPETVQSWFYPGSEFGVEFPAPKSALKDLAQVDVKAPEPVPSTEQPEAIAEAVPTEAPAAAPEPAPAPAPEAKPEPEPVQIAENTPAESAPSELPRTASDLPFIELIGLASLAGAVFCRFR